MKLTVFLFTLIIMAGDSQVQSQPGDSTDQNRAVLTGRGDLYGGEVTELTLLDLTAFRNDPPATGIAYKRNSDSTIHLFLAPDSITSNPDSAGYLVYVSDSTGAALSLLVEDTSLWREINYRQQAMQVAWMQQFLYIEASATDTAADSNPRPPSLVRQVRVVSKLEFDELLSSADGRW